MQKSYPVAACQAGSRNRNGSYRPLRLVTFLAPNLIGFYQSISRYLARKLHYPTDLSVGSDYAQLAGQVDLAFVCGLPYVEHTRCQRSYVEPLVAPVLAGDRYGGQPIYYSDVIVRQDSPFQSFADLRGRSWAYNEPHSQSGYGITRFHLVSRGETNGFFTRVVEAGWHERAIRLVCSGAVDGSAIDSHVLATSLRQHPGMATQLRVIEVLGPSPIQPVVVGRHLSRPLKEEVRAAFLGMGEDPSAKPFLEQALVERFVPVTDATYDRIRQMVAVTEMANYWTIR
jgi:phosphonate transport system substrate-binding protein